MPGSPTVTRGVIDRKPHRSYPDPWGSSLGSSFPVLLLVEVLLMFPIWCVRVVRTDNRGWTGAPVSPALHAYSPVPGLGFPASGKGALEKRRWSVRVWEVPLG